MGYTKSAVSGFGWQTVLKIGASLTTLVKIAVLARLLSPDDFGLFSLAAIALGVSEALTETGINITLLQTKEPISHYIDTAWVIAIVRGLIIALIMLGLGLGMNRLFHQPDLLLLVVIAAAVPVIKGFINPAIITLYKDLAFFNDAAYRLILVVVEALLAVLFVWWFKSVTSWMVALVATSFIEVAISFIFFRLRPKLGYASSKAKIIFQNARGLSLSSLFSYLNENADNLIVGKLLGTYSLGLYQNAYALSHKPNYEVTKSIHHSTLPIYSRIESDGNRLRRAFGKTLGSSLALTVVASLPLLVAPEFFVQLILGDQWLAAGELVRWLVLGGLLQALAMIIYTVFLSRKSLGKMNLHQALSFVSLVIFIWYLGGKWGAVGAAMGVALSRAVMTPVLIGLVVKELRSK